MSTLNSLKLVVSKKLQTVSPIVARRNKLCSKLDEQLKLCEAKKEGKVYSPTLIKTVVNKQTGERVIAETTKRVREWFWINDNGKINLAIKYGAKTLPLNRKGANAIEISDGDELIATLKTLKVMVANGELDEAINEMSLATRKAFAK